MHKVTLRNEGTKVGNYLMAKMALYVMWEIMIILIIYKFQKI